MTGPRIVLDAGRMGDNDDAWMAHKTALIFGITGQDGSYLSELLLSKGYDVHGLVRRTSIDNRVRLSAFLPRITLHEGDVADTGSIWRAIQTVKPNEIYNLAAQTHVHTSFSEPEHTGDINALGVVRMLDAVRSLDPTIKFYQASTSELFGQGSADGKALNENSPMLPVSPYGVAKLYAFHMVRIYREAYGLFACNGILFNHESPRRGHQFVTSKIAEFAKNIRKGQWDGMPLSLGNLDAKRDWGHARDYAEGMWRMLQADKAEDYVLATGVTSSVRDFVEAALGFKLSWIKDKGVDAKGRTLIVVDENLYRPIDVSCLMGDASKAKQKLGWVPLYDFSDLVSEMVEGEVALRPAA